jgi:hypothetical protein
MNMFKRVIVIILCSLPFQSGAIGKGDKLLVYFSDNVSINQQYYEVLKIAFPELDVQFIKNQKQFDEYIPKSLYAEFTGFYGRSISMSDINKLTEDSDKQSNTAQSESYYFFDIGSTKVSGSYYTTVGNNMNSQSVYYEYLDHSLQLVKCQDDHFFASKVEYINVNKGFGKQAAIPLSAMSQCSDWINPVFVSLYLKELTQGKFLEVGKDNEKPCDIEDSDTIFISPILNRDKVSRQFLPEPREYKFKKKLRYFKHRHVKLKNDMFGAAAVKKLKKGEHFYFFYFTGGFSSSEFYIIDALDFTVKYSSSKKLKVMFVDVPFRKYIKKTSKFGKKCLR